MFDEIAAKIAARIQEQLASKFQSKVKVSIEQPKQNSFGELAIPVAFQLARELKRPPKQIAEELAREIEHMPGIAALEIAGNGYINVRLARGAYAESVLRAAGRKRPARHARKKSSSNIPISIRTKPRISGTCATRFWVTRSCGCCASAAARWKSRTISITPACRWPTWSPGSSHLEKHGVAEVRGLIEDQNTRFDYLCWDLYARMSAYYQENPAALEWRAETLHEIEAGKGELAELGHLIADAIVKAHLKTMSRLGIRYDLLPRESEILHLHFWAAAFELLKQRGAIYFEEQGKNKGCWVMPSSAFRDSGAAGEDAAEDSKVIVRSNGTVTYVGKDIAYQLWKFGLLGKDFYYRIWSRDGDGHLVWVTSDEPGASRRRFRPRGAGVQRNRLTAVVLAGCRGCRVASARLSGTGTSLGAFFV